MTRAAELKRNFELGHVDDHFHAGLFALKFSRLGHHREIGLAVDQRGNPRRSTADHDGSDIFVVDAVFAQRKPHRKIGGGAGNVGRQSSAL